MKTRGNKRTSTRRQGMAATLASGFLLLALVFSISLASPRPETASPQQPSAAASVPAQVQSNTPEPVKPALLWTGNSREDVSQRRLPGHSELDLQLD